MQVYFNYRTSLTFDKFKELTVVLFARVLVASLPPPKKKVKVSRLCELHSPGSTSHMSHSHVATIPWNEAFRPLSSFDHVII